MVDESDEEMSDVEDDDHIKGAAEEVEYPEIIESDIELDESDIVDPDNDEPQLIGDPSVEVTEESHDASQEAKSQAMEAISEGKLEEASELLTKAILLNPTSAIMYATGAAVYIKMKKPNAAIRDANAALEINPDSAKGYKSHGIARAMLGLWADAAKDLHVASKLDFDEEISAVLKNCWCIACNNNNNNKPSEIPQLRSGEGRLCRRLSLMHVELKSTTRSMIGCVKNEKIERLSERDNEERLKLRLLMTRPRRKKNHQGELVACLGASLKACLGGVACPGVLLPLLGGCQRGCPGQALLGQWPEACLRASLKTCLGGAACPGAAFPQGECRRGFPGASLKACSGGAACPGAAFPHGECRRGCPRASLKACSGGAPCPGAAFPQGECRRGCSGASLKACSGGAPCHRAPLPLLEECRRECPGGRLSWGNGRRDA